MGKPKSQDEQSPEEINDEMEVEPLEPLPAENPPPTSPNSSPEVF